MEYDNMFGINSLEEIENYLTKKLEEAYMEPDYFSAITLLNELMGFCRDTSQKDKGVRYCKQVMDLMGDMSLEGTYEYATTLLNVANAYRAFGYFEQSMELYKKVEEIYKEKLPSGEFNYASLYNNWSLLYQEIEDYKGAKEMLEKALFVVDSHPSAKMEQATTRTNLAVTLLRLYQLETAGIIAPSYEENELIQGSLDYDYLYNKAINHLKKALSIYESDGGRDFHYSGALSAMGDALYIKKDYEYAIEFYKKAMEEIERHVGQTEAYKRVEENYNRAKKMLAKAIQDSNLYENLDSQYEQPIEKRISDDNPHIFNNNLERCKAFYEKYGRPMIKEKFPEYVSKIAVGLVGEGSDCFGYDDDISKDHDYGVGFCMWLKEKDYQGIGVSLHQEYEKLVLEHGKEFYESFDVGETMGEKTHIYLDSRRGVFTVKGFYGKLLGDEFVKSLNIDNKKDSKELAFPDELWAKIPEESFATATNGEVFRDDEGTFSVIRKALLAYYPKKTWYVKLAQALHTFSQNGQYNYSRMMARRDYVTAGICVAQAVKGAMEVVYLLNQTYAPYYKWMWKGMERLDKMKAIVPLLEDISLCGNQRRTWEDETYNPYKPNMSDKIVAGFEAVATLILGVLNEEKIIRGNDTFLDVYCKEIAGKGMKVLSKKELVEQIVKHEWQQFDKVKNEGGRADCQDDFNTFSIMRRSQYNAWPEELLESYLGDLFNAEEKGWNLIMEKYARMMESTAPDRYEELKKDLPVRSLERIAIQEEIIKLQVEWMEDFAKEYPKMAGNARSIHTSEDNPYNTSYETYLRGELGTYSEKTLLMYGRFIVELKKNGENLAYNIMSNTARLYGYESLEEAERKI